MAFPIAELDSYNFTDCRLNLTNSDGDAVYSFLVKDSVVTSRWGSLAISDGVTSLTLSSVTLAQIGVTLGDFLTEFSAEAASCGGSGGGAIPPDPEFNTISLYDIANDDYITLSAEDFSVSFFGPGDSNDIELRANSAFFTSYLSSPTLASVSSSISGVAGGAFGDHLQVKPTSGLVRHRLWNAGHTVGSGVSIGWSSSGTADSLPDTLLKRVSAGVVGVYESDGTTYGSLEAGKTALSQDLSFSSSISSITGGHGLARYGANVFLVSNNSGAGLFAGLHFAVGASGSLGFSSGAIASGSLNSASSPDTRLQRVSAGVVGVYQSDGTTFGTVQCSELKVGSGSYIPIKNSSNAVIAAFGSTYLNLSHNQIGLGNPTDTYFNRVSAGVLGVYESDGTTFGTLSLKSIATTTGGFFVKTTADSLGGGTPRIQGTNSTGLHLSSANGGGSTVALASSGIAIVPDGGVMTLTGLPTSDPAVAGQVWDNGGLLSLGNFDAAAARTAIGLGDTNAAVFLRQVLSGQSLTGVEATSVLNMATTWNTTGTPTAINLNVTDTASNAASLLMNLQVASTSIFKVGKGGVVTLNADTIINRVSAGVLGVYQSDGTTLGEIKAATMSGPSGGSFNINSNYGSGQSLNLNGGSSGAGMSIYSNDVRVSSATVFKWGNDLIVQRDAANTLAQRNATNAQAFRVYGTYTDASNYVRGALSSSATAVTLAAETAGTGADDIDVVLTPAGAGAVKFGTHSAIAAETVTGYITITDAGGTSRKLAVVS